MTWTALEGVLEASGYPYARQGSYAESEELPPTFLTFWNIDVPSDSFYDDDAHRRIWRWQIYLYTKDPRLLYSVLDDVLADAKSRGFVIEVNARDIETDTPDYVGRTARILYSETLYE